MNDTPTCRACGKSIPKNPKWAYSFYLKRLHCNRACADADRPDILADYTVSDGGCWLWQGHIDANGYGKAYDASLPLGKDELHTQAAALRIAGLTYAGIAEALQMSGQESAFAAVQAAVAKGLVDPGAVPPVPRLSEADRRDIRALYQLGVPQTEIGSWYGVDSSQISRVCSGFTSGHQSRSDAA